MPELPDVEIFRQYFEATALQQKIVKVHFASAELVKSISLQQLRKKLENRSFRAATRHGKYLFAASDGEGSLVLHFGMTGFLKFFKKDEAAPDYLKLVVEFASGYRLGYDCRRKLGQIGWTEDIDRFIQAKGLGPDPLTDDFNQDLFMELLAKRRGSIKGLLMNQKALSGIGNVYSDEILFQVGIHPKRSVKSLAEDEQNRLYDALQHVLRTAIDRRVGEKGWPEDWLLPRRQPEAECPRCGGEIRRIEVSGRGAYCCTGHQQ